MAEAKHELARIPTPVSFSISFHTALYMQVHKGDQPIPMSLVASLDTVPVACCVPLFFSSNMHAWIDTLSFKDLHRPSCPEVG